MTGGRALWTWPAAFVTAMIGGALLGFAHVPLPGVEAGIALSVLLLGLAVGLQISPPASLGALACSLFAVWHGFAHGAELSVNADPFAYMAGFAGATAVLHIGGLALGVAFSGIERRWMPSLAGGTVAVTGLVFLAG